MPISRHLYYHFKHLISAMTFSLAALKLMSLWNDSDIYHLNLSLVAIQNSIADIRQKQRFWFSYSTHRLFFEEPNQRYFKQILPVEEQRIEIDWYAIMRWGIKHIMVDLQRRAFFRKAIAAFFLSHETISDAKFIKFDISF